MNPLKFVLGYADPTDPTKSLKHLAYAAVVTFGCFWLTWDMIRGPIDAEWVAAFGLLLGAVTTGKVVGSAPSPAPTVGPSGSPVPSGGVVSDSGSTAGSDKT